MDASVVLGPVANLLQPDSECIVNANDSTFKLPRSSTRYILDLTCQSVDTATTIHTRIYANFEHASCYEHVSFRACMHACTRRGHACISITRLVCGASAVDKGYGVGAAVATATC